VNKILTVDPEKCTGCRMCELVCSMKKHGEFNSAISRITTIISIEDGFYLPIFCFQCDDYPCGQVCPSGAISRENGVVRVDEQKCIGCRMCLLACPFGAMNFYSEGGYAINCDTCDGDPECIKFCYPKALSFRETELSMHHKKKSLAERLKNIYGEKQEMLD
jgi:carbon-monoxide dehydrogenase iron sulfur subunit